MPATKKNNTRSIEELTLRYARFCQNNDLDEQIPAEEQIVESERQQRWLDSHIAQLAAAEHDENHDYDVAQISAILTDLGREKEAVNYTLGKALRKGETLLAGLTLLPVARQLKQFFTPQAKTSRKESSTNKGVQLGLF